MKVVRIIARNPNALNFIDLATYNYDISEVNKAIKIYPELADIININTSNLNRKDAVNILNTGNKELSSNVDIKKYNFTSKEIYEFIKKSEFDENFIELSDFENMKDYQICETIMMTGTKYINQLQLDKLTARKWLEILKDDISLLEYCDLNKFIKSNIFNSVELVCLTKQDDSQNLHFLIKDRNYKKELSALGWERLIINFPKEYIDECCYWKLNESSWSNILFFHPNLSSYKML